MAMNLSHDHTLTTTSAAPNDGLSDERQLALVADMMREMSLQTEPQTMVSVFRRRMGELYVGSESISISRRGLRRPQLRITRSSRWSEDIDPWKEPHRLPLLSSGLLSDLIYGDRVSYLPDVELPPSDPASEHIAGARSILALPIYENGIAVNMVVRFADKPHAFDNVRLADSLMVANLFGRATNTLLLARRLERAYAELDHELRRVAEIQRALLPPALPRIPTLDMAAWYQTATRVGGDYYDFFDLRDGRWGVLIADVSGHGTPAAVVMAMTRTLLHGQCYQCASPPELLERTNQQLCTYSDRLSGSFVTAFYGVYDPRERVLTYSSAGHNPPLLVDAGIRVRELDDAHAMPLAVERDAEFSQGEVRLGAGDTLLLYTDGITEAVNPSGEMYGRDRLLSCVHEDVPNAQHIIDCVTSKLMGFTGGGAQTDDQTLVAMRVRE